MLRQVRVAGPHACRVLSCLLGPRNGWNRTRCSQTHCPLQCHPSHAPERAAVRADTAEMSGSAAAALAELENFGAYGKAPAPAEEEAPPPKRQRAPARSSASLLAEAEAELASSQVE